MKPILSILTFLILQTPAHAQELLANGRFEDPNTCREYDKECAPEAWLNTSLVNNYFFSDIHRAFDGTRFCGVIVGDAHTLRARYHSFLFTRLLCTLRKGHRYRLVFHAWSNHPVTDSLGVYFSPGDFLFEKRAYWQITPSGLVGDSGETSREGFPWRRYTLDYTARGDEYQLVLGSFKRQPFQLTGPDEPAGTFYLYIDSVSLRPLDPRELICRSADSMVTVIYHEDERHNLLEKKRQYYKNAPPPLAKAPPTIEQHIDTLLLPDILFATGSAGLQAGSHAVLDSFCRMITAHPTDSLVINGHTDSVGTLNYNMRLSADRARSVENYIRLSHTAGLPTIYVRWFAFLHPVSSNATPEGRRQNRRVELLLYRHED